MKTPIIICALVVSFSTLFVTQAWSKKGSDADAFYERELTLDKEEEQPQDSTSRNPRQEKVKKEVKQPQKKKESPEQKIQKVRIKEISPSMFSRAVHFKDVRKEKMDELQPGDSLQ